MEQQVKFLLVSNARSGSTWLQTSLARLPDISTDHEILFRKGYHGNGTPPLHVFVDAGWSATRFLSALAPVSSVVGSRLVLVGFGANHVSHLTELASAIDPEIRIVQVTRSYWDCFKSSMRGHYDLLSDHELEKSDYGNSALSQTALWATMSEHGKTNSQITELAISAQSLEDSRTFLIKLFTNDLMLLELCRRAKKAMRVPYDEIGIRFHEIAAFLGSQAAMEDCAAIINRPVTNKLPPIPDQAILNYQQLMELTEVLENGMRIVVANNIPFDEVWTSSGLNIPRSVGN